MADVFPWERTPTESDKEYQAFATYRDLGYGRSIAKAGKELGLASSQHLEAWSSKNGWVERSRQYDAYLEQTRRRENENSHLRDLEAHRRRAQEFGSTATETARLMLELANHNLRVDQAKLKRDGEGGVDYKKAEKVALDKSLAPWVRAAGIVGDSGQAAEAQALGVEKILTMFTEEQGGEE